MSKPIQPIQAMVFCGIDVSAATLAVAAQQENQRIEERVFDNTASGHKALIAWLQKGNVPARVSLEATGIYSLDLALALNRAAGRSRGTESEAHPPLCPDAAPLQDRLGRRPGVGRIQPPHALHALLCD